MTRRGNAEKIILDFAKAVHKRAGRYYTALYKQAGNSIAVPIFESIFRKIILNETA